MACEFSPEDINNMKVKYPDDTVLHEMLDTLATKKFSVIRRHQKKDVSSEPVSEKRVVTLLLGISVSLIVGGKSVSNTLTRSISNYELEENEKIDANAILALERNMEHDLNEEHRGRGEHSVAIISVFELES